MPFSSWCARPTAHSYGVAGSRVVPRTMIGFEPAALIWCGLSVGFTGQLTQDADDQAMNSPNRGDAALNSGTFAWSCAIEVKSGRSEQLTAIWTSFELSAYPDGLRSVYSSARPSRRAP